MSYDKAVGIAIKFLVVAVVYSILIVYNLVSQGPLSNLDNPRTLSQGNISLPKNNQTRAQRIAPVGKTKLASEEAIAVKVASKEVMPVKVKSGEEIYNSVCFACHGTGILESPKKGDVVAWESRLANGLGALVTSAINGKGAMPPRGGIATLSDDEIKTAVEFMIK